MFSAVGGFRFIGGFGLNNGIYLMSNIGDIQQGFVNSNGIYFVGEDVTGGGANSNIIMTKLGSSANTVWSTQLTGSGTTETPSNLILDSSDNSIVVGQTTANVSNSDMYISKFDSSGSLAWQHTIGDTYNDTTYDVALNNSEANVIVTGRINTSTTADAFIAKLSSSTGSVVSQHYIGASYVINSVTTDSSNNIYLLCSQPPTASREYAVLFKCQSDMTITWQKFIGYTTPSTTDIQGVAVAVDSNGNVYATISRVTANEDFLVKLNSSGALQWQTTFNYGTTRGFTGITIDSTNNIYIAGVFAAASDTLQLLKFDSSGGLTWGRGLTGYGGTENVGVNNISWYNGRVLLNGYSYYAGTKFGMLLSVADNGVGLGTKADGYVWGFSPFTLVTSSLNVSTSSITISTATLTDAAGTLTASSYSTSVAHNILF